MMTDARTWFSWRRSYKAEDVIKDHIDKPLIVARTEELVSHDWKNA
jgi:hypothetical protein